MTKELSVLLKDVLLFTQAWYFSKPYTDLCAEEGLLHFSNLAKIQLQQGIDPRSNYNIVDKDRNLSNSCRVRFLLANKNREKLEALII